MMSCGISAWLIVTAFIIVCTSASPFGNKYSALEEDPQFLQFRTKRPQIIEDCMVVGLEENTYFYKSRGKDDVCGLYLVASPEQKIEITLESLRTNCETGLVTFLDGWEMGGEVFPPLQDAPMDHRTSDFCGSLQKKLFTTESNAATILYRLPNPGDKFKISVKFIKHHKPCNVLLIGDPTIITLRNYGLHRNCSVATANPSSLKVMKIAVGKESRDVIRAFEHQTSLTCAKGNERDWVEIGGSFGLDNSQMIQDQTLCGVNLRPKLPWSRVWCDVTSVRLVSSGIYENYIRVFITPLSDLEMQLPTTVCEVPAV